MSGGAHARRLAVGTAAYQASHLVAALVGFAVSTLLGRRLTLPEFGVYGLVLSISLYIAFLQGGASTAAVRRLAASGDPRERDRVLAASFLVFGAVGVIAAAVIAAVGNVMISAAGLDGALGHQARTGVLALAAGALVGWPMRIFSELLRAGQRFRLAALSESAAYVGWGALIAVLVLVMDAPLWVLVGATGAIPLLIGMAGLALTIVTRTQWRPRSLRLSKAYLREYVVEVSYVATQGATAIVVEFSDRGVLALFAGPASIGLFEAAVRPSNLVRQLHNSLLRTVIPATSSFRAQRDDLRTSELLVRGTRYVLAASLPVSVTLVVLSGPLLELWLGERFLPAATALSILVATQLFEAGKAVATGMLMGAGQARRMAVYTWASTALQLALSVALVPLLGLEGVVVAFFVSSLALFPPVMRLALTTFRVQLSDLVRRGFAPAYGLAALLAGALVVARLVADLEGVTALAVASGGVLTYWLVFYLGWVRGKETALRPQLR